MTRVEILDDLSEEKVFQGDWVIVQLSEAEEVVAHAIAKDPQGTLTLSVLEDGSYFSVEFKSGSPVSEINSLLQIGSRVTRVFPSNTVNVLIRRQRP